MDEDDPRYDALNLLELSSIAFLEAQEIHGEPAAVAAKESFMNKYIKEATSQAYRAATTSKPYKKHSHRSGLTDNFLNELVAQTKKPCAGKYEQCRSREVNEEDVKKFVYRKPSKEVPQVPFDQIDFDEELNKIMPNQRNLQNAEPKFSSPLRQPVTKNRLSLQTPSITSRKESPPRKIIAQTPPAAKQSEMDYLLKLNNNFAKKPQVPRPTAPVNRDPPHKTPKPMESKSMPKDPPKHELVVNESDYKDFKSARSELRVQNYNKYGNPDHIQPKKYTAPVVEKANNAPAATTYKTLAGKNRYPINKQYQSPVPVKKPEPEEMQVDPEDVHPLLKGIDPEILDTIKNEVINNTKNTSWDDIAGLESVKKTLQEVVVLPLIRPDIFKGLRSSPKGMLLFGPPGTGKTLIGRCVAAQSNATFFSISASTLTSKWIGQGEKLVRALFMYARFMQPSVIFLDEIDSILMKRSETEHESSRRLKTEFLVQLDGAFKTDDEDQILVIGATNRPMELDDAARRRFTSRLYIPLPCSLGRKQLVMNMVKNEQHNLSQRDFDEIAEKTEGYSGADLTVLVKQSAVQVTRGIPIHVLATISKDQLRKLDINDFHLNLQKVKPSVSQLDLNQYTEWNNAYGSND